MWLAVALTCLCATSGRAAPTTEPPTSQAPSTQWPAPYPGIAFEELQPRVRSGDVFLVDVRNRSELLDPGRIPNSLNLPLHELAEALAMSRREFGEKYGFQLPEDRDQEIILTCRSGRRVRRAAAMMIPLGFSNIRLYYGSFNEWKSHAAPSSKQIGEDELTRRLADGDSIVIDIRSLDDLQREGSVTGSHEIPLNTLRDALHLPPSEFQEKFGFKKPAYDDQLTVIGASRDRPYEFLNAFNKCGYCDLRLFLEPLKPWASSDGDPKVPTA